MGIAQDMEMLQMLQSSNGAQQPQQGMIPPQMMQKQEPNIPQQRNPIASGAEAAIAATKRSLEMSDAENNRALGRSIIQMMSNVYKQPSWGTSRAGNIGALGASFGAGLEAYDRERDRIANINHMLQTEQKREEALARREEREMKKMEHDMRMAQQNLAINQGYLGLEKQKREDDRKDHEELSKAGAKIPLSSLKTSQWNIAQKEIQSNLDKGQAAHDSLQSIYAAKRILREDPNITKNMSTIMLAAQRNDPNIVRQKLNSWLIPEETRVNAEMLAKHLSNLYTSKLKGFPARGMNMFLEKQLREGSVDINMTANSIIKLLDKDEKVLDHIYKSSQEVYDEYEKGYFYRPRPMKIETEMVEDESEGSESPGKSQNQAILEEIQRLEKMMELAPE